MLKRSGVQLLTPLHTRLQKNRTARSGLNWCTHVHLHWWDNWTDWPLKCLLKWPEPQQGKFRSFSFFPSPNFSMCNHSHILYLSDSGRFQTPFRVSTHLQKGLTQDRFQADFRSNCHNQHLASTPPCSERVGGHCSHVRKSISDAHRYALLLQPMTFSCLLSVPSLCKPCPLTTNLH